MGFVTSVEHPPAVSDAKVRASHALSARGRCQWGEMVEIRRRGGPARTHVRIQEVLGVFVSTHIDSPGRDVTQQHGPQATVQAAHAIFEPDDARGARQALVDGARGPRVGARAEGALGLQARLDHIEGACHDTRGDAGRGAT